ncbi:MFS transporter [Corynebacterium occultum]|uniref:MFS transporter n=1 Tax=Corynebacterium occultum TaxID=2675219 RepID=UPI001E2C2E24|nr:MFS transporter [Corynebacterium occultum]
MSSPLRDLRNIDSTPAQRWTFLAVISTGLLLIGLDNSILFTALPELRTQLQTSELEGLWIINAYSLVLAGLLLGTGTLGDKIGHRLMFTIGLTIFGLASLGAAFAPSAWALVAARAVLGLGAATMMPATLALIQLTFHDERERNTAIGIWGAVAVVGAALGPVVGGALLEFFWWGSVFLINVPVAALALVLTILLAPPNMPNPAKHWDWASSLYSLLAMAGLVMVIKESVNPHRQLWLLLLALVSCALGSLLFLRRQRRLADPMLEFSIFRSRMFSGGVIAAALAMFLVIGIELMTTQRFQLAGGFSPFQAGLLVAIMTIAAMPMSVIGGANLHRLGFRTLISGGFAAIALGTGLAAWAFSNAPLWAFICGLLLIGLGSGSVMSVSSTAILGAAPPRKAGMAAGVEEVSYEFGTLLSVSILGSLLPLFYSLAAPPEIGENINAGLAHPQLHDAAVNAYDSAYLGILVILTVLALLVTALTAWCFRGNPKGAISYAPQ